MPYEVPTPFVFALLCFAFVFACLLLPCVLSYQSLIVDDGLSVAIVALGDTLEVGERFLAGADEACLGRLCL